MKLRLATFNVENLFARPVAMNQPKYATGQPSLKAAARLNELFGATTYTPAAQREMLELLRANNLLSTRSNDKYLELRKIRGRLFTVPKQGKPAIVATGRGSWIGWIELKKEAIRDQATVNTAKVIAEVNADVLVLVEVEDRPKLEQFNRDYVTPLMKQAGQKPYAHCMVIDGNDGRGIDVAVLSRFPIDRMRSHVDDVTGKSKTFSRDCPEYYVDLGKGRELVVLPNHFASKGSDFKGARRKVQAAAVRAIYEKVHKTNKLVLVAGDLNDYPKGGSLNALLKTKGLRDAMSLPCYSGLPGTYGGATERDKIDYLLMSPALQKRVTAVDVFRQGTFSATKWTAFPGITAKTKDRFAASDHQCVWVELGI